jgi:hypothetical protein
LLVGGASWWKINGLPPSQMNLSTHCCCQLLLSNSLPVCEPAGDACCLLVGENPNESQNFLLLPVVVVI